MRSVLYSFAILLLLLSFSSNVRAQQREQVFKHIVDTVFKAHPAATGIIVSVVPGNGPAWNYAVGVSDKRTGQKLQADQPVLTASNTKTYIAASILKLNEQHKLHIDDSIGTYLSKATLTKLIKDGYKTGDITLVHLLSHTSGIADYVDDTYFDFVNMHRMYNWTRDEQIDRAMEKGSPLAAPGDTFKYADVNYLLLTEIMEQVTHQPFYRSVRKLLGYRPLKLHETWFTKLEARPVNTAPLAHQYWNKYPWDSYDLDPSWDLYGGGGIAATAADISLFFKYLFEGKIIQDSILLARMYADVPRKTSSNYCLGIRKVTMNGLTGYYHGGFWGTDAIYFPKLRTAITIIILEKSERDISAEVCKAIAAAVKSGLE